MALIGLGAAFIAAAVADLRGTTSTRRFTRSAFFAVALIEGGLRVPPLLAGVGGILP